MARPCTILTWKRRDTPAKRVDLCLQASAARTTKTVGCRTDVSQADATTRDWKDGAERANVPLELDAGTGSVAGRLDHLQAITTRRAEKHRRNTGRSTAAPA